MSLYNIYTECSDGIVCYLVLTVILSNVGQKHRIILLKGIWYFLQNLPTNIYYSYTNECIEFILANFSSFFEEIRLRVGPRYMLKLLWYKFIFFKLIIAQH